MLRAHIRQFSSCSLLKATSPSRGKAAGFAKKSSSGKGSSKRVTPGSLYKNFSDTINTSGFNKNAIPVELPVFKPAEDINAVLNKVSSYSEPQYRTLFRLGSFKKNQHNELFPKPISLIRENTTNKLIDLLKTSKERKYIITGEPGVGKSVLMAQLHAYAFESKYIIINISNPDLFLNGRSDFFYNEGLNQYVQPMYLKKFLRKILKGNDPALLKSIKLKSDYKFSNGDPKDNAIKKNVTLVKEKNNLFDLLSIKTLPLNRGELFKAVITEVSKQENAPVLISVDNVSRLLTTSYSAYKNVENKNIFSLELQVPKFVMDSLSGDLSFKNKGSAVIMATSSEDRTNKTLPVGLGKIEEDSYIKGYHYESQYANMLKKGNVKEFSVPKLAKNEVRELIEFYLKSAVVPKNEYLSKTVEQITDEKYLLSGNGNPRELIRSIVFVNL